MARGRKHSSARQSRKPTKREKRARVHDDRKLAKLARIIVDFDLYLDRAERRLLDEWDPFEAPRPQPKPVPKQRRDYGPIVPPPPLESPPRRLAHDPKSFVSPMRERDPHRDKTPVRCKERPDPVKAARTPKGRGRGRKDFIPWCK